MENYKVENIYLNIHKETSDEWETRLNDVLLNGSKYNDKYVAFWGSCFSNFFPCNFTLEGKHWTTSEKYFMWKKAMTFGDTEIADEILNNDDPRTVKKLGRQVKDFSSDVWDRVKFDIMYNAVKAKFTQDSDCNKCIKIFEKQKFIEGSPYDVVWGVGIRYDDENVFDENKWKGENLLGKIVTIVRDEILKSNT